MSKTTEQPRTDSARTGTGLAPNSLGFVGIAFFVIAAAAPMAAFVGAGPVLFSILGPGVPLVYVLVALVIGVFSVGYLRMSRHVVSAGGFVAYIARGLGPHAATGAAGIVIVTYVALQVGLWAQFGVFAQQLATQWLGLELPVWAWVLGALGVTTVLTMRGVTLNLRVLGVLLVLEIAAVATLVVGILAGAPGDDPSLVSFQPAQLASPGFGVAVLFVFACFTTFEATTVFSEEARAPRRTIPRALYAVILFVGVFYTSATWAVSYAVGPGAVQEAATDDLAGIVFTLAAQYVGPWLDVTMQVLVVSSFVAMLIGMQNMFARYCFALARARVLPRGLAVVSSRSRTPARAALAGGLLVAAVVTAFLWAGAAPIEVVYAWFVALGTTGFIVMMALASLAILAFFLREDVERGFWATRVAPVVALALMATMLGIALANYDALLFSDGATAKQLLWLIPLAFAGGALLPRFRKGIDYQTVVAAAG
ncbi:APC family permease [Isoptericola sp. BMS4]|uniref:APC family permease n=1 Tax=Isoptericola sp. BMS4 TaxID=2527875 RepID=UPI00196A21AB|nr:APC family permease [Isoptericola sp. BMS4]